MEDFRPGESAGNEERSVGGVFREVAMSLRNIVRSEIHLAKAEVRHALVDVKGQSSRLAIFSVIAALGILPLMSFLVIGLGRLLNDNYWLSSLIIFGLFSGVGGVLAYGAFQKMHLSELSFPHVRNSLTDEKQLIERKLTEVSRVAKEKMAEAIPSSIPSSKVTDISQNRRIS